MLRLTTVRGRRLAILLGAVVLAVAGFFISGAVSAGSSASNSGTSVTTIS